MSDQFSKSVTNYKKHPKKLLSIVKNGDKTEKQSRQAKDPEDKIPQNSERNGKSLKSKQRQGVSVLKM